MRIIWLAFLFTLASFPAFAQRATPALDCVTFDLLVSRFGDTPFMLYESDGDLVTSPLSAYLQYLDSTLGGDCAARHEPTTPTAPAPFGFHHFSEVTHTAHGLLDYFVLEPGWYRYETHNVSSYRRRGMASIGSEFRPELCHDLWADAFVDHGRFTVKVRCKVYLQVFNDARAPWSLTISLED